MIARTLVRSFVAASALFAAASPAFAHAKLIGSRPVADETLASSPERVELEFSVRVQPAASSIAVNGPEGGSVAVGEMQAANDEKKLSVTVPQLTPGEYRVLWRVLSADDHVISGEFSFRIGVSAASRETSDTAAAAAPAAEHDHSSMDQWATAKNEDINWRQSLIRWLIYAAMMTLTGGLVFIFAVVRRVNYAVDAAGAFDDRAASILFSAATALVVLLIAALGAQTSSVYENGGFVAAFSVLTETSFGIPWLMQAAGAVLAMVLIGRWRRARSAFLLWAAFAASLAIVAAPALTGHARAATVDYAWAIPSDWLHLLGASVWIGGLVMMAFAVPALIGRSEGRRGRLAEVIGRFNTLAIAATALLAITGLYNTWIHVESLAALTGTLYGKVLLTKVALTALMILTGSVNAYIIRPRLAEGTAPARSLFAGVMAETMVAAVVLLLAAILAFLPPAREHVPAAAPIVVPMSERND
jgi:copper transport protein